MDGFVVNRTVLILHLLVATQTLLEGSVREVDINLYKYLSIFLTLQGMSGIPMPVTMHKLCTVVGVEDLFELRRSPLFFSSDSLETLLQAATTREITTASTMIKFNVNRRDRAHWEED